jgi:protein ImuB
VDLVNWSRKKNRPAAADPVLLIGRHSNQLTVKRACPRAEAAGVRTGMALEMAKALVPAAVVKTFDPLKDFQALIRLGERALKFTPLAGPDADLLAAFKKNELPSVSPLFNGLILDMTGTDKLYKNDLPARRIVSALKRAGIEGRAAAAPSIGAAWAASRYLSEPLIIIPPHRLKNVLAGLPVDALRLEPEIAAVLHRLGLHRVGDLLHLPPKTLLRRFGLKTVERIDQAFGRQAENFEPLKLPEVFYASRTFESPLVNRVHVQAAVLQLFEKVFTQLAGRSKKAGCFIIQLRSLNADFRPVIRRKEISLTSATTNFSHLSAVLEPLLESLYFEGGITDIGVKGKSIESALFYQMNFAHDREEAFLKEVTGELMNNLVARLGRRSVRQAVLHESYIPERSFGYVPVGTITRPNSRPAGGNSPAGDICPHLLKERPPCLLPRPEPITAIAMLPDAAPVWIKWQGRSHKVSGGMGPERISPEWWREMMRKTGTERDYFKVQDQNGEWLWVFREKESGRWFVHGVWS